jgi:phage-related tail fiber protein
MSLILTRSGLEAYAQADATGSKLQATHMAVGDGGGAAVSHTSQSSGLVNETWRGALQEIKIAASGEVEFIAHVPITMGGWYIREIAIYADDTLLAVGAHPEIWKPEPDAPDKVELEITAPIKFDNASALSLTVDTTKVLASQEHVATKIAEHDADATAHADMMAGKADADHVHPYAPKNHAHTTADVADLLSDSHEWQESQAYALNTLSISAGTVTWDMGANPNAVLTLTEDVTSLTLTNVVPGATYELTVLQGATGGRSLAWPASILWAGGTAVDVTQDANAEDVIMFTVRDNGGTPVVRGYAGQDMKAVA